MKLAARQHHVPAGYLAGFTIQGKRDSAFFVHSLDGSPVRNGTPNSEAYERHYNTIDLPGFPPDHLEKLFAEFETPACALFRKLATNPGRPLVTDEEFSTALNFFALQAARSPQCKAKYENLIVDNGQNFMELMAHSPMFFQAVITKAIEAGVPKSPVAQDWIREAVESNELRVVPDRSLVNVGILVLTAALIEQVCSMSATLLYTDGPDWFVCSDHPSGLFYSVSGDMFTDPKALQNPSVKLHEQQILHLPIAKNVGLILHRSDAPTVRRAPQRIVAAMNAFTISHAQRFVFSPTPSFISLLPGGQIGNGQETLASLRAFLDEAS